MNFIRRLYYNNETGEIIMGYSQQGNITIQSQEEDYKFYEVLNNYNNKNKISCMEWIQPDKELEKKLLTDKYIVKINITSNPHTIIFDTLKKIL